jgi:thiamine biosynthesis lipoprotein ApbE
MPWCIQAPYQVFELHNEAASTSATVHEDQAVSDVVDPRSNEPLIGRQSCTAIAKSGAVAEIISTTFLVLGGCSWMLKDWQARGDKQIRCVHWMRGERGYEKSGTWGSVRSL